MTRPFPSFALLLALSLLAGCDGNVTTSTSGSGGSGGTGATAGSGGTAGNGGTGGQPTDCPTAEPTSAAPCNLPAQTTCKYGDTCCPNVWGCSNGQWNQYDVDCGAPASCPDTPPTQGAACGNECSQWSPCAYACDGANSPLATCVDGTWSVESFPCADPVPCGDVACAPEEICVASAGGAGIFYACQPNPCEAKPLSCQCAASLCGSAMYECQVDSATQISCSCSMCP